MRAECVNGDRGNRLQQCLWLPLMCAEQIQICNTLKAFSFKTWKLKYLQQQLQEEDLVFTFTEPPVTTMQLSDFCIITASIVLITLKGSFNVATGTGMFSPHNSLFPILR